MRDKEVDRSSFPRPPGVDPAALLTVVRVPREWARWRVDRVVHATFPRMSRTRAQEVVRIGAWAPEGKKLAPNHRVRFDEIVLLYRPPFVEPEVPTTLPVLYEDDALLAVDKPPFLPVHPTARWHHHTVTAVLASTRPPGERLALCHRIDRETSGVLLLAKTRAAERFVKRAFEKREQHADRALVSKSYLAITRGVPSPPEGRIDRAMKLDAVPDHAGLRVKMRIVDDDEPDALTAATRYAVIEARGPYALVRCDLETGRQHQIRAHLAAIGTPIVGDKLYGPDVRLFLRAAADALTPDDLALLELPRHALHAHRLELPHPTPPHQNLAIASPLPDDLQQFWTTRA